MINLPDVTLVVIETREHDLARLAMNDCLSRASFGDVVVFTNKPESLSGFRTVEVPDWPSKEGWSRCFWYEVPLHVKTSHILGIQWDSWIVAPEMWRDEYLKYDYIGAPWWYKDGMNVGNGGFSLRSTSFARFVRKNRDLFPCVNAVDDDLYCRKYRPRLQDEGFLWAPEHLAHQFSFECVRPDPRSRSFGFHAVMNFEYGCDGDEGLLLERAELMMQSSYIYNGRFWKAFSEKHPHIVGKLKEKHDG